MPDIINKKERPPVVVIMGHIDHGKSTLLSKIRKNNKPLSEAGDITQHISAYEVEHVTKEGKRLNITFLDTPGHEAFTGIRKRGAQVADIAILVVSAEDGVKPQTIEAYNSIKESGIPFMVAINKIDKPDANIEKTKQSLAEIGIYIEGYGGDVPAVSISAKTGQGVSELLDMIILVAELNELKANPANLAEGVVIESNLDIRKGITATCIIKNGSLEKGMYIASGSSSSPIRIVENYLGKQISSATFSSPIRIIGWDNLPNVGDVFKVFRTREEMREYTEKEKKGNANNVIKDDNNESDTKLYPIVVKADAGSSLEAIKNEIKKLDTEKIKVKIISSGVGTIGESDVRVAMGKEKAIIVGFNSVIDGAAKSLAERSGIEIKNFDIIYKLSEWLKEKLIENTPKIEVWETFGMAKILKIFSKTKNRQVIGGRVENGQINIDAVVKIIRRDAQIGEGKIRELQKQRAMVSNVDSGNEFGAMIVSDTEIAPGDYIENLIKIEK